MASPDIREIFFPKGSRWDAHVVLRDLVSQAKTELVVVDPYCDKTLYQLLEARSSSPLSVRILCRNAAKAVSGEAKAFMAQFPGWTFSVRVATEFHDRFAVVDGEGCYHLGASINGAGERAFMISKIEDPENQVALINQIERSWLRGTTLL